MNNSERNNSQPKKNTGIVIDTNVLIAANGKSDYSEVCEITCAKTLLNIKKSNIVVVDNLGLILSEYGNKLSWSGEPRPGDVFFKWLHDNEYNNKHCIIVNISPIGSENPPSNFAEFPTHSGLSDFVPSDKKFVAVANAHPQKPPIIEATDTKWWGWCEFLLECQIVVLFVCEEEIRQRYKEKFKS